MGEVGHGGPARMQTGGGGIVRLKMPTGGSGARGVMRFVVVIIGRMGTGINRMPPNYIGSIAVTEPVAGNFAVARH